MNRYPLTIILLASLSAPACHSIRTYDASDTAVGGLSAKPHAGNFYYLPKVRVRIAGGYTDKEQTVYQIKVSREVQADRTRRLFAEFQTSSAADDRLSFVVNSKGLLDGGFTNVNSDRTGSAIESVANTALNVWQISSYGPMTGQIKGPKIAGAAATDARLKAFDLVFDPYDDKYHGGYSLGDFILVVNTIAGAAPDSPEITTTLMRSSSKAKPRSGLVFRAPEIVEIALRREGTAASPAPAPAKAGDNKEGDNLLAGAAVADDSGIGEAAALTITASQQSNDVVTWTLHQATTASSCDLNTAVKAADPRPGAEVAFSMSRAAFVKKSTALTFVDGELLGVDIRKPSQLLAFVRIPETITAGILKAIPAVVKITDNRAERAVNEGLQPEIIEAERLKAKTALLIEQKNQLQLQIDILAKQKELQNAQAAKP